MNQHSSFHLHWLAVIVTFSLVFAFIGCQKQPKLVELMKNQTPPPPKLAGRNGDGSVYILGRPKQNPYTVTNMQTAYTSLNSGGVNPPHSINIRKTFYYVKFKPQNFNQYEALTSDTTIDFNDIPIEATILQDGDEYHDPSLPDSIPTYQYAAVPISYNFNDSIPYEIISNLYIPETDSAFLDGNSSTDTYVDKLLDQAYIQTSNFEDTIKNDPGINGPCRQPGGQIRVFDTRLNTYIGMEGVRMRARRWFTTYYAFPDYNGNYRMASCFRRPCNYSLVYARSYFAIRWQVIGTTAWINGPRLSGDWNFDLADGIYRLAGHVFRGGFRYHYKNIGGLLRPQDLRSNYRQIYVAVNASGVNKQGINWSIFPIIKVWRFKDNFGTEYLSDDIFSTTCHETAHTTHGFKIGNLNFIFGITKQIRESWAIGVE